MPQARSGGSSGGKRSGSSSGGGARRTRSTGSKAAGSRSTGSRSSSSRSTRAAGSKRTTAKRSTGSTRSSAAKPKAGSPEARVEAAANRVRKLNEQIIEAGKDAGETTLDAYEKFLKSIAGALERGPGKSDVEWIANLASAQAKFIRDVTSSLTKAARKTLK